MEVMATDEMVDLYSNLNIVAGARCGDHENYQTRKEYRWEVVVKVILLLNSKALLRCFRFFIPIAKQCSPLKTSSIHDAPLRTPCEHLRLNLSVGGKNNYISKKEAGLNAIGEKNFS